MNRLQEIERDAAYERQHRIFQRNQALATILRLGDRYRIGHVVSLFDDIEPDAELDVTGSYVVEVIRYERGSIATLNFATVHCGEGDHLRFERVDEALLHLIARRHGQGDSHGAAALHASRVLGVTKLAPRD